MIKQLHEKLIKKQISAKELAEDYLNRIKRMDPVNPDKSGHGAGLNAFITVTDKLVLEQAENIDKLIAQDLDLPLLAGIPASIKDVIMTNGIQTTAGSQILKNYVAPYDASLVKKLKEQGMVLLGKNNCDEFAMGGSGENSSFGPTKNPYDLTRVSGGSSGGSAVAVAADLSVYSIGTDTGGSVRQPAAFCGVVGFKPTYGAISRYGLIAMASSLDQAGIIAKCIEDVEIVFDCVKGKDRLDSTSLEFPISNESFAFIPQNCGMSAEPPQFPNKSKNSNFKFKDFKVGVPREYFIKGLNKEVEQAVKDVIKKAQELGAKIIDVSLPNSEYALAVYYIIMPSEASANLARYDGIRYGNSPREKYFGDEVKRRIMLGAYALSAGYYNAYYKKAQQVRKLINMDFEKIFKEVDILITPTTPSPAFKLGEKTADPLQMYLEDIFTVPVNVAGLPAISMPCGKTKNNLPIGVQLIGKWLEDSKLLAVAKKIEDVVKYNNNN